MVHAVNDALYLTRDIAPSDGRRPIQPDGNMKLYNAEMDL